MLANLGVGSWVLLAAAIGGQYTMTHQARRYGVAPTEAQCEAAGSFVRRPAEESSETLVRLSCMEVGDMKNYASLTRTIANDPAALPVDV
jgi:hypothetical protein